MHRSLISLSSLIIRSVVDIAEPFLKEIVGNIKHFYFSSWDDLVMICVGSLTVLSQLEVDI